MTRPYEAMTDAELDALTEEALRDHQTGAVRMQRRGEAAVRTRGTVPISLRVPASLLEQIKSAAAARDLPYQRLIKLWLEEALAANAAEAPERPLTLRLTREHLVRLNESGVLAIQLEVV